MEATIENVLLKRPLNPQMLILRGILSVGFGILALLWPAPGLLAIAVIFGAYALANGIATIATGVRRGREGRSWGLLVFEGILGLGAGVVTLFYPAITLFALSVFVGVWAVAIGVVELVGAFQLQKVDTEITTGARVLMGIVGLLSLALGGAVFLYPGLGTVTLLTLVATYAIISGFFMIGLGSQINRTRSRRPPDIEEREFPKAA